MEKKNKKSMIIGITALLLVTLTLLGLTYAYYRTRIVGNENDTSVSVTSKKLEIEYSDDGIIAGETGVVPGYSVEKTFSVTNKGLASSYVVILENVVNEFTRKYDLTYTLECSSVNTSSGAASGTCEGVTATRYPATTDLVILQSNEIGEGITHNYTLTVNYANLEDVDQSEDMGKTFSAKINIANLSDLNQYSDNTNTLAYNILNNAITNMNGTELVAEPMSDLTASPATSGYTSEKVTFTIPYTGYLEPYDGSAVPATCEEAKGIELYMPIGNESLQVGNAWVNVLLEPVVIKSCDGDIATVETVNKIAIYNETNLVPTQDDYGTTYYYRGLVADNYVNYSGACWRIVRIQGDGSVKLILEDSTTTCEDSYQENLYANSVKNVTNLSTTQLKNDTWCLGNMRDAYDSIGGNIIGTVDYFKSLDFTNDESSSSDATFYYATNLNQDSLICDTTGLSGETFAATQGSLTANEVIHAGQGDGYLGMADFDTLSYWRYIVPDDWIYVANHGYIEGSVNYGNSYYGTRPVIVLKNNTVIQSGDGTKNSPYEIAS